MKASGFLNCSVIDLIDFYMMSGYSVVEEGTKASSLGANGYLQLPVEAAQLKELFESV